jgi:peptidoglycan/xylan/chitin deacetylase (PgdA/CDA1 family)
LKNPLVSIWGSISPLRNYFRRKWFTFLLYHQIEPILFENHIEYLEKYYKVVSLDCLHKFYLDGYPLPPNPLFITFDDGWRTNYDLLPFIKKKHIPVTIFLTIGFLGTNRKPAPISVYNENGSYGKNNEYSLDLKRTMLNVEEIQEMSNYVNFQSHGVNHHPSTLLSEEDLKLELMDSKQFIEEITGKTVYAFAYPYNRANEKTANIVESCGYVFARVGGRVMNRFDSNRFLLNCIGIDSKKSVIELQNILLRAELKTILQS